MKEQCHNNEGTRKKNGLTTGLNIQCYELNKLKISKIIHYKLKKHCRNAVKL